MTFIAVVGSRGFTDYDLLVRVMDDVTRKLPRVVHTIVSGGARGADTLAERFAEEHDLNVVVFTPDWARYGNAAGPLRNRKIVDAADIVVAFWDGESRGTASTIKLAKQQNKMVHVILYNQPYNGLVEAKPRGGLWGE